MKRSRFVAAVVALTAIVAVPLVYAGGLWYGLPVVGGLSYCSGSTVAGVPGTTGTCNATASAGPTGMTGQELIPADLNPSGTQALYPGPGAAATGAPQTGYLPLADVASGAYQVTGVLTPTVTFTDTIPNGVNTVLVEATGTQTYVGFILPNTPTDGQLIRFASIQTISAVGMTVPVGNTAIVQTFTRPLAMYPSGFGGGASTLVTAPFGFTMLYSLSTNTWYRIQ